VVLAVGKTDFELQKIRIGGKREKGRLYCCADDERSRNSFLEKFLIYLDELVHRIPLWGCILIGGKSSRMGRPKHLLKGRDGNTWLERTVTTLRPYVTDIVFSGAGEVPPNLNRIKRLADIPGTVGPLAGILSAARWRQHAGWILVACDMPDISGEAIGWLAEQRRAGHWGVVPKLSEDSCLEPLLACYDMRAVTVFEELLAQKIMKISRVGVHPKVNNPLIPSVLAGSWRNINTPEQLGGYTDGK
jgi:molybdopterin-guanine dinucleotide biosynthesis protein A